jgi:hypothetical protein
MVLGLGCMVLSMNQKPETINQKLRCSFCISFHVKPLLFASIAILFSSCFLFRDLKKDRFSISRDGIEKSYTVVVPKGVKRKEKKTDSLGNVAQFYYYADGAVLYFADMKDTTASYQAINYEDNVPKEMYNSLFFKGIDGSYDHFWRETRFGNYRVGYYKVDTDEDWKFDSAVNYFTLRSVKPVQ